MNSKNKSILTLLLTSLLLASYALAQQPQTSRSETGSSGYVPVTRYDPKRNAAQDLTEAISEASRTGKNVMVEVGGDWCSWCHTLDNFFAAHQDLIELRDKNFVTLKINFSQENENEKVLSQYPQINGYPHIFFLNPKGKLLQSQDTSVMENGSSYNLERVRDVLTKWAPKQ